MEVVHEHSYGVIPLKKIEGQWHVFIILHKHGNHWGFPKGNPNVGENPQISAHRELEEETGLTVEKQLLEEPITEEYSFVRRGKKVQKKASYFPAIVSGTYMLQPEEIQDGKWLSFEQAIHQLTFQEAKKICRQIQEMLP